MKHRAAFAAAAAGAALIVALLLGGQLPPKEVPVSAQPIPVVLEEGYCANILAEEPARYLAYDVVIGPDDHKMGPELMGDAPETVLTSLKRHLCLDPALLYDLLEAHDRFGYDAVVDLAERQRAIEATWTSPRAQWDDRVKVLIEHMRAGGFALFKIDDASLESWFYRQGVSPAAVPELDEGDLPPEHAILGSYWTSEGELRTLRLRCGGQPARLKNVAEPTPGTVVLPQT